MRLALFFLLLLETSLNNNFLAIAVCAWYICTIVCYNISGVHDCWWWRQNLLHQWSMGPHYTWLIGLKHWNSKRCVSHNIQNILFVSTLSLQTGSDLYHVRKIRRQMFDAEKLTIDCSYSSIISKLKVNNQGMFRFQNVLIIILNKLFKITSKVAHLTLKMSAW